MKAVVAAFNQEKALVGAFSVIMLRMQFGCNFLKHYCSLLALVLQYIAVLPILSVPRVCLCCKDHKLFINCLLVLLAITSIDVLTDQLSNAPNTPFLLQTSLSSL